MAKIVVAQNLEFSPDQIERLGMLGELDYYDKDPETPEDWMARCQDADIVCSGSRFMKTEIYKLSDKFFTIPMVGYSWLDLEKLRERNIILANCPGCNKYAVTEWIIAMMINLLRNFSSLINSKERRPKEDFTGLGLKNKRVVILGHGNIGKHVGEVCLAFGMIRSYFNKGDDLLEKTADADVVINCLSTNETTTNLLNREFFFNLKRGSYFVTITPKEICDTEAMFEALDKGIIAGVATDCASAGPRDVTDEHYLKMAAHPKILATPHMASRSDVSIQDENTMMTDNIEAYLHGKPINIVE